MTGASYSRLVVWPAYKCTLLNLSWHYRYLSFVRKPPLPPRFFDWIASFITLGTIAQQNWATNAGGLSAQVSTLAGDSIMGAPWPAGITAKFGSLTGVAVSNEVLYIADSNKDCIFQLDLATGAIRLLAGGTRGFADGIRKAARFINLCGLAADRGGHLYVADVGNQRIRCIELATGTVTTLAGSGQRGFADGPGPGAQFNYPTWVAVDSLGNVYATEDKGNRIRQVEAGTNKVRTLAGSKRGFADGTGAAARLNSPEGLALDGKGNLYVADYGSNRIRRLALATGKVTSLAGSGQRGIQDGPSAVAQLNRPMGVAAAGASALYLTDRNNNRICQIELPTETVRTLAGNGNTGFDDGPGVLAQFIGPEGVAVAKDGAVYLIDVNYRVRVIRQVAP